MGRIGTDYLTECIRCIRVHQWAVFPKGTDEHRWDGLAQILSVYIRCIRVYLWAMCASTMGIARGIDITA